MPFDGTDFNAGRKQPRPTGDRVFGFLFLFCAICLLVVPISGAALVDIVHYFWLDDTSTAARP